MDTLELLNKVARHLTQGLEEIEVLIQEPRTPGAKGEAWRDSQYLPVKIALSRELIWNGEQYLETFLHEVAHVVLHVGYMDAGSGYTNNPATKAEFDFMNHLEGEANILAWKWIGLANHNAGRYQRQNGNYATDLMQRQLIALFNCAPVEWMDTISIINGSAPASKGDSEMRWLAGRLRQLAGRSDLTSAETAELERLNELGERAMAAGLK